MAELSDSELTDEQNRVIDGAVAWFPRAADGPANKIHKVTGPAGCGKSEVGKFVIRRLIALGYLSSAEDVCKVGPTGMAARVMRNKGLYGASTIHSALYTPASDAEEMIDEIKRQIVQVRGTFGDCDQHEREEANRIIEILEEEIRELRRRKNDDLQWILNYHGKAAEAKLILCDEASMVGGQLMLDLQSFGIPVLYLGDRFQLPNIGGGESVFEDANGRQLPVDGELTQIHRQAEGSAIIRYSRDIRLNENGAGLTFFGKDVSEDGGMLLRLPPGKLTVEHLARANQVICGYNNTRHATNQAIREFLGRGGTPYPVPGDKLVCLKNHKDYGLVNGSIGVATSDYSNFDGRNQSFEVDLTLDDGREMPGTKMLVPYFQYPGDAKALEDVPFWARKKFAHFDYGNTLTCHKAQGTQHRGGVVIEEPFGRSELEKRRWRYTAATRFEKFLIVEAQPRGRR
jgi:exodeoxyribonuclease-5